VGSLLIAEGPEGMLLRPAAVSPIEVYSPERKAEFLLGNAVSSEDYPWARANVRELSLDPMR
jgi:hypothetical protein